MMKSTLRSTSAARLVTWWSFTTCWNRMPTHIVSISMATHHCTLHAQVGGVWR
ncbi:hypothetical protein DPMN_147630 [Dreissena polymorpha]|uniref:Uncharacterized protein n=1 Tax=Dreissena polymorpha TaxID=45954 RepID=A0A9D4FA83_DREPO|nr:hypothetical protein DPMN_147630 [Dreissena polymorpha]